MDRPTFLMAEVEPPEGISARKLVLETGKFNVITAYSGKEAVRLFEKFPGSDAVILHSSLRDLLCEDIVKRIKAIRSDAIIIVLSVSQGFRCDGVKYHVSSHEPHELLSLLRDLFGDPRTAAA
jgi:DNA-binding response OmpR family regulator